MKIIKPDVQFITPIDGATILKRLEQCGRVCYKSEDKITEGSAEKFVAGIIKRGHEAVLEHCSFMAVDLMECLEFITLPNGDVLHGTSMSYEVQDGVLHFFVNYNLTLRRETEETAMETLETTVEPKKG